MRWSIWLAAVLCAVALGGCARGPKSAKEGMHLGDAALRAGELSEAEDMYTAAFELADGIGNDSYALFAGDCAADVALARHAPQRALPLYARIAERYPDALVSYVGRFRIPNNLGVLLARAGRVDQGIEHIERALTQFEGRGISPAFPFQPRAVLTRNLVRMQATHGWNARSEALLQATLVWLERDVDQDRNGQFTAGAHALFTALADLAAHGPRPAEAGRLYARAEETAQLERAYQHLDVLKRVYCEPRAGTLRTAQSCYETYE